MNDEWRNTKDEPREKDDPPVAADTGCGFARRSDCSWWLRSNEDDGHDNIMMSGSWPSLVRFNGEMG